MVGGGWVGGQAGPKHDCFLVSLRLNSFYDTTSSFFTPNLTVQDRFCMILRSKVSFLLSFVAKNQYCTDTSVQCGILEGR